MSTLILLLVVLTALHHWLAEPLLQLSSALFALSGLPWLALAALAWLIAGASREPHR